MRITTAQRWHASVSAVLAMIALPAAAQGTPNRSVPESNGGGGLNLMRLPAVQRELKMTPDQVAKVDASQRAIRQSLQQAMLNGGGDATGADLQRTSLTTYRALQARAVTDILTPPQQRRLHELELQRLGLEVIARPDVAAALKLTPEQRQQAVRIDAQADAGRATAHHGINPRQMSAKDRTVLASRLEAVARTTTHALTVLLTADQKRRWGAMVGAPFAFPK